MELKPILQVLWRSRTGPLLLMLQIAIIVVVLINAFAIVQDRLERLARPTGIDHANQFVVSITMFRRDDDVRQHTPLDLAAIRALPGVIAATPINAMPASNSGWTSSLRLDPDSEVGQNQSNVYIVDEHGLDALGVHLVEGRNFEAGEIGTHEWTTPLRPNAAIVSRALAEQLFPGGDPLGRTVYYPPDVPVSIIGVIDRLVGPHVDLEMWERSIVFPAVTTGASVQYLVRTEPGRRDAVMAEVEALLHARDSQRVIERLRSQEAIMARAYEAHRGTSIVLMSISAMLLAINALGVVGLASFLVNRRRQQIGTRRALGATRFDVCRYFMTEIGLIAVAGLTLGVGLTLLGSHLLTRTLALPPVELGAIGIAGGIIVVLTQLAALGPALGAASVPPALATRTV